MTDKYMFLDFEFNGMSEPELNLVSCALELQVNQETVYRDNFWLLDDSEKFAMSRLMYKLLPEYTVVAYALQAEARCLFDLCPCLTPEDIKGIDLYLNYRMLLNHNDKLSYGKQLIGGVEKVTRKPKPKYQRTEEDATSNGHKPEHTLVAACYKLLEERIDAEHKDRMRDIIIRGDLAELEAHKAEILAYGESDIKHLPRLLKAMRRKTKASGLNDRHIDKAWRNMAEYAVRSAWMERIGYPVNVEKLKKFVDRIPDILTSAAEKVNAEHPDIAPFLKDKKTGLYVKKEKPIVDWITANHNVDDWMPTDKGKPSLSLEAFRRYYDSKADSFGGAMVRYLYTKQSLNGFTPGKSKRGSFFDYLGSDGRARPYFGIYGSQTSRSQPSATGFLPLKANWMRWFIQPPPGRAIVGIDYASQEFLIAALLSNDQKMIAAYGSGDVYLAFGKDAGYIPKDATKASHGKERDIFKTLVLGVSYDMSGWGLAARLTQSTGREWTEGEATKLIEKFYDTYHVYADWKRETYTKYLEEHRLTLSDGWTMFGDNDNYRSVGNFPTQGHGAVVMRKAVSYAQASGIKVIYTLHDALYAEVDAWDGDQTMWLGTWMHTAFKNSFDNRDGAELIRLDAFQWSGDYVDRKPDFYTWFPIEFAAEYVDDKGRRDFEHYKKFLAD